ncbi:hypothetical protein AB7849_18770 [Rhodanobacter sp. 115]|uniref:hypothetical protein n=2 Tax=Rhodanobacter sp. FW021-MT20 TaxID=1162282 RepID=UPI000260FCF7|nr:metal dependent phosphohydrolase [Rhodanobacter sp. 115]
MMSDTETFDVQNQSNLYLREGVLLWDTPLDHGEAPFRACFVLEEGLFPVQSWVAPTKPLDQDCIDKVTATLLVLPDDATYVLAMHRDEDLDPLTVTPRAWSHGTDVLPEIVVLLEWIESEALRRLVRDVFSLRRVFQSFWFETAGRWHHPNVGGLARHSLEVALAVQKALWSSGGTGVTFTALERDLGLVAALLHGVGKVLCYTEQGCRTERAQILGDEMLGLELIGKPLETLRANAPELADALTALLLSRTKFSCSRFRLSAIRDVISRADRDSARKGVVRL